MPPAERRLLARLALVEGSQAPLRADLAAELWSAKAPEEARKCLSNTLTTLGKALRLGGTSPLVTTAATAALLHGAIEIDVVEFLALIRAGDGQAARQLYRGPLLPDEQAPWLIAQRARLQAAYDALDDMPVVLTLPSVRRQVPVYRDDFIGRDADVARLLDAGASHRLVTIAGPGGCGKTRLLVESAARVNHHDLIVFVPLEDSLRGDSVLDCIRAARGLQARPRGLLRQLVADLQTYAAPLLLLDNLEQHVGTARLALLGRLIGALPGLCIWASSRQPLGLDGEDVNRPGF